MDSETDRKGSAASPLMMCAVDAEPVGSCTEAPGGAVVLSEGP